MPTRLVRGYRAALIAYVLGILLFGAPSLLGAQPISELSVPSPPRTDLYTIASGPDGAIWFVEEQNFSPVGPGKIGRITTDASITEFVLGTAGSDAISATIQE